VVHLNPSTTELTTAATDAAMGVLSFVLLVDLRRLHVRSVWQRDVWSEVFGLLLAGSVLGAVAHGVDLAPAVRAQVWLPLYLSLGLAVALFVVGAVGDWSGDAAGRRLFPWAVAAGVGFFAASQWLGGAFIIFVLYEAGAMLVALAIYVRVAARGQSWAWWTAAGIGLTLVAAAVQASSLRMTLAVPLDHNGLFHLVQMVATVLIAAGVRKGFASDDRWPRQSAQQPPGR
jgi:hypothetical protein